MYLKFLGFEVSRSSSKSIADEALSSGGISIVNTINPHSYIVSKNDKDFKNALLKSDYLVPDGSGIVFGVYLLHKKVINRVTGYDLFASLMGKLNAVGSGRVYFVGSTDEVLHNISVRCGIDFPKLEIKTLSLPFKEKFEQVDAIGIAAQVNEFKPDILFVGLTAPKQEKLIDLLKESIDVKVVSGIGAVFDFYSGRIKRPGKIWCSLHLEWLIRLMGEPKRLWKRNMVSTPLYLRDVLIEFLFKKNRKAI